MLDTGKQIWKILEEINDPEVPVLSILDLGIVREVKMNDEGIEIIITPTYSGCPAMDVITIDIKLKLAEAGYKTIKVTSILSPSWTTDWMSESGKQKLKQYSIAPPLTRSDHPGMTRAITCPQCNSSNTRLVSEFGSTACKALYQCNDCKEPFDYFKCH